MYAREVLLIVSDHSYIDLSAMSAVLGEGVVFDEQNLQYSEI